MLPWDSLRPKCQQQLNTDCDPANATACGCASRCGACVPSHHLCASSGGSACCNNLVFGRFRFAGHMCLLGFSRAVHRRVFGLDAPELRKELQPGLLFDYHCDDLGLSPDVCLGSPSSHIGAGAPPGHHCSTT